MSQTLERIRDLIARGEVKISEHGYDELSEDGLTVREVLDGFSTAVLIEDYPNYHKGPCVLVFERGVHGRPVHAVWGIPRGQASPAVLVTAYRPDPDRWSEDFTERKA